MVRPGEMSAKAKAAEGFFNGFKFSLVHMLVYTPFYAKMAVIESGRPFVLEYLIRASKVCLFYPMLLSCTFGLKHFMAENKDRIRFDLQYNFPILRNNKTLNKTVENSIFYCSFSWPIGFVINYLHTGRYLRGGASLTVLVASILWLMDPDQAFN